MRVEWLITLRTHQMGRLDQAWSALALAINASGDFPLEHLAKFRYKGDAIGIELHVECSCCSSWHSFRLSYLGTFHPSKISMLEHNLCRKCFGKHFPQLSRRGMMGADLTLGIDFCVDSNSRKGTFKAAGTRVFSENIANCSLSSVTSAIDWPGISNIPVLELIFVCPRCRCEQIATSSEAPVAPPLDWICAYCHAEHKCDWAWDMEDTLFKECVCYFCDRPILALEAVNAEDPRFDARGFSQCFECLRIKHWAMEWRLFRTVSGSLDVLLSSSILALIVDFLCGTCNTLDAPYRPSVSRLRFWKMIPAHYLPLVLDHGRERCNFGQ